MPFETDRNWRIALGNLHASENLIQAVVLLVGLGVLVTLASWPLIGAAALLVAGLAIAATAALALRLPPWAVMRLYGGRAHEPAALSQVETLVAELAARGQLPRLPRLYVIPSTLLSAFSAGTADTAAVAVTEGLLRRLTMREIAAVLAHEISHLRRGDFLAFGVADIVTRFAQALYFLGLVLAALNLFRLLSGDELIPWLTIAVLVLAPALLNLLQLRLSHARELAADREAAFMTGDPLGLASAISRLETSTGNLYDDLIPPVPARRVPQPSMLRCPPPAERRIDRLRALEAPPMPPLDITEGPRISLVGVGPIEMRPRYRWPGVWF
jgi:heat shock protein HtpX